MNFIHTLLIVSCLFVTVETKAVTVDPKATPETRALYANLKKLAQRGVMFGHQDDALYGVGWKYDPGRSDVKSVCGDYPALFGWELGHLEAGRTHSLDSVSFDTMRVRIQEVYRRGGVNTISWHLNNPLGGTAWDCKTTESVKSILPGGSMHNEFNVWLDRLAAFLGSLKDDSGTLIPLLFRPYHEHTGSWFWWGARQCTPAEYIALWKYTVNYLTKTKGLHNLLFVYSPAYAETQDEYFERYPGDNMVDVLGIDIYHDNGSQGASRFISQVSGALSYMTKEAALRSKVAVLSETGSEALPMADWWTGVIMKAVAPYHIAYFMVWRNAVDRVSHFFAPYPGQGSAADFIRFKNSGKVFFESSLPSMYKDSK
jgi:hypothetical protein